MSISLSWSNFTSWFGNWNSSKKLILDSLYNTPLSDDNTELINVEFARNSRELLQNEAVKGTHISSLISSNKLGIIGSGVNIQSRIIGNAELNAEVEDALSEFSEYGNCDITGRWHLDEAWQTMVEFTDKEGGFILRHHYNDSWSIPYRFELISVGMIDTRTNPDKDTLNGLKKDKYGRVSGVYIFKDADKRESSLVSMDELIFYSPVWVSLSQYTPVSKLVSVLSSIDQLDQYSKAELDSAIERAKAGKYWKTSMYDDIMKIVKNTQDATVKKEQLSTLMKRLSEQTIKPRGLTAIPLGDEIVKDEKPSGSVYTGLSDNTQLKIASSQGLSSQIVYQDPSKSNYSAIKAMLSLAQINWSIEFKNLREKVMKPVCKKVITACVTSGRLTIPEYFLNPRKFQKLEFMRVSEIDIEPKKTADANAKNLANGLHSPREIVAKRGRNIEDVHREQIEDRINFLKMEKEMYEKAGLELNPEGENKDEKNN